MSEKTIAAKNMTIESIIKSVVDGLCPYLIESTFAIILPPPALPPPLKIKPNPAPIKIPPYSVAKIGS